MKDPTKLKTLQAHTLRRAMGEEEYTKLLEKYKEARGAWGNNMKYTAGPSPLDYQIATVVKEKGSSAARAEFKLSLSQLYSSVNRVARHEFLNK